MVRRIAVLLVVPLAALSTSLPTAADSGQAPESRIAAISGVHTPHQGFALAARVPSDALCLELAQNLASELGIVVHVVCTNPAGGATTVVAECGYARSREAKKVESYTLGWGSSSDPFLICVPPDPDRFNARRVRPNVTTLRPKPR